MKRWNGWGNTATIYPLPASGRVYLQDHLGEFSGLPDALLEDILPTVPASRLPAHKLVRMDARERLFHSRGQSLPDWVALRSGCIPAFPDGVTYPRTEEDVVDVLAYARRIGAHVIPYGGGTSVVGHINPIKGDAPVLSVDMSAMDHLLSLDEVSRVAVFESGVTGPALEAELAGRGYTLGHFPQSHEYSTLGGWIAARSSGQQSYYYGRIESLFAGGRLETPLGRLDLPHFPASAAGPDVKEMVLGSEGRIGIITQAQVRVRPRPQVEQFHGVFFPTWERGLSAVRAIAQEEVPVSMLRLSNPLETETTLVLSGKPWIGPAGKALRLLGFGERRCLLVFGVTGTAARVRRTRTEVADVCHEHGGLFVGSLVGHTWEKSRFLSPYLRNTLWDQGVAVDTLETALPWKNVEAAAVDISASICQAMLAQGEKVLVIAHLSHVYRDGASVYTTFLFRRSPDPEQLLERWRAMKAAASRTIQRHGGTISHQHGVGEDHAAYLLVEKGTLGMQAIRNVCAAFDPEGMMNPGKLF